MKRSLWQFPVLSLASSISLIGLTLTPTSMLQAKAVEPVSIRETAAVCTDTEIENLIGRWHEGYLPAGAALRNCGDRAITPLAQAMSDPSLPSTTQNLSGRLIGQIGSESALQTLLNGLENHNSQASAIVGLSVLKADNSEMTEWLMAAANSNDPIPQVGAAYSLAVMEQSEIEQSETEPSEQATVQSRWVTVLAQTMSDESAVLETRNLSARLLAKLGSTEALENLTSGLQQENEAAIKALIYLNPDSAVAIDTLTAALTNDSETVSFHAAYALSQMKPRAKASTDKMVDSLTRKWYRSEENENVRAMVTYALGELDPLHPDVLSVLGDIVINNVAGYYYERLERSPLVQAVAVEALEKVNRQENARSLFTAINHHTAVGGAEFILEQPIDPEFEATLLQILPDKNEPSSVRIGAAKFIADQAFNPEIASNFEPITTALIAIANDTTEDIELRFQALNSLSEMILLTEGKDTALDAWIPQLLQGVDEASQNDRLQYGIMNVLGAIYARKAYPNYLMYHLYAPEDTAFNVQNVEAIEAALINIVTSSDFYQQQWAQSNYFPGPYELEALSRSPIGLAFGLLHSMNMGKYCTTADCAKTPALQTLVGTMENQDADLFQLWLSSSEPPHGSIAVIGSGTIYSFDREAAIRLAESNGEQVGDRAAICYLDTAPQIIPMCANQSSN